MDCRNTKLLDGSGAEDVGRDERLADSMGDQSGGTEPADIVPNDDSHVTGGGLILGMRGENDRAGNGGLHLVDERPKGGVIESTGFAELQVLLGQLVKDAVVLDELDELGTIQLAPDLHRQLAEGLVSRDEHSQGLRRQVASEERAKS
jgi:hypothetical protein